MDLKLCKSEEEVVKECKEKGLRLYTDSDCYLRPYEIKAAEKRNVPIKTDDICKHTKIGKAVSKGEDVIVVPSHIVVHEDLFKELNEKVKEEDCQIRKVSTAAVRRTFVYCDISDFSKFEPDQQSLVIDSLAHIIRQRWLPRGTNSIEPEAQLCIGDGYICVFKEALGAVVFASKLANMIQEGIADGDIPIEYHFRMSVHTGPVFFFWDHGRDGWNYVGDAINGGNRVLSAIGKELDDVIYISEQVVQEIRKIRGFWDTPRQVLDNLVNKGRHKDKHGKPWRVHHFLHERFRSQGQKEQEVQSLKNNFERKSRDDEDRRQRQSWSNF